MSAFPEVLETAIQIRMHLRMGMSVHGAIQTAVHNKTTEFSSALRIYLSRLSMGQKHYEIVQSLQALQSNPQRKALLFVLNKGYQGHPIDDLLGEIENEFMFVLDQELERFTQVLPIKLIFPLVLFILPSIMILLISPLLALLEKGL